MFGGTALLGGYAEELARTRRPLALIVFELGYVVGARSASLLASIVSTVMEAWGRETRANGRNRRRLFIYFPGDCAERGV